MRIGGLPSPWCTEADTFEESIDKLKHLLQPINIKLDTIFSINDTRRHVPLEHCVMTFKDKEEQTMILQQSHLLKGTKLWFVEKLTANQLKAKASELKKMYKAHKQGGLQRR